MGETWKATGYDIPSDTSLIWFHLTPSQIQEYEDDMSFWDYAFELILGLAFIILAALINPILGIIVALTAALIATYLTIRYNIIEEMISEMKAERTDGWEVYKIEDNKVYWITGERFWEVSLSSDDYIHCGDIS